MDLDDNKASGPLHCVGSSGGLGAGSDPLRAKDLTPFVFASYFTSTSPQYAGYNQDSVGVSSTIVVCDRPVAK